MTTTPTQVNMQAGSMHTAVAQQWAQRPNDEKFLDLESLHARCLFNAQHSSDTVVSMRDLIARETPNNGLMLNVAGLDCKPTNYSFGQTCVWSGTPAAYLRRLPGDLVATNLNYMFSHADEDEKIKVMIRSNGATELRAMTGPKYGRIWDHEIVGLIRELCARDGAQWKVPGVLDWGSTTYDAEREITKDTTTLYASDRDVFVFLVDDLNPIEIGKLRNGDPDLMFRGFYAWNSEVGSRTFGMATMYMRAVCENRILWGVEQFTEKKFRHTKNARQRLFQDVFPMLREYRQSDPLRVIQGVQDAQKAIVANTEDKLVSFFHGAGGYSGKESKVLALEYQEQHHTWDANAWDVAQLMTSRVQAIEHTDARIKVEQRAGVILDKVA